MTVLLVAHGTRNPRGVEMTYELAEAVGDRVGRPTAVSFVDVVGPSPSDMLAELQPGPVTVLPAFLARGHHVCVDVPRHVAKGARPVLLADALGPSPMLARALTIRLAEAGTMCNDAVVLAAAGSSDPAAHRDIEAAAEQLSDLRGAPVEIAFAGVSDSSPYRSVADTVADLRRHRPGHRIAVASYLLADGLFQRRLDASGADTVARPLGMAPTVVALAAARVAAARPFSAVTRRSRAGIPV